MKEAALVALSFLQAHEGWLQQALGPLAVPPSTTAADLRLHVDQVTEHLTGASIGAALTSR